MAFSASESKLTPQKNVLYFSHVLLVTHSFPPPSIDGEEFCSLSYITQSMSSPEVSSVWCTIGVKKLSKLTSS